MRLFRVTAIHNGERVSIVCNAWCETVAISRLIQDGNESEYYNIQVEKLESNWW